MTTPSTRVFTIVTLAAGSLALFEAARIPVTMARATEWSIVGAFTPVLLTLVAIAFFAGYFAISGYKSTGAKIAMAGFLVGLLLLPPLLIERTPRFNYVFVILNEQRLFLHEGLQPQSIRDHNWPALFVLTEMLTLVTGASHLDVALWTPLVGQFSLLLIATGLALAFGRTTTESILVGLFAVVLNWVGQDYLSLQHVGLLLYIVATMAAIMIYQRGPTVSLVAVLLLLACGLILTHLLSALLLVLLCSILAFVRARSKLKGAVPAFVIAMIFFAWNVMVSTFFLRVGKGPFLNIIKLRFLFLLRETIEDTAQLSVAPSFVHNVFAGIKLSTVALVLILAVVGGLVVWKQKHAKRDALLLGALIATSSVSFVLGPYGGEILFRIYMFALPAVALLCIRALREGRLRSVAPGIMALLAVLFVVNHYANELVDVTPQSELVAAEFADAHLPSEITPFVPGNHVLGPHRDYATTTARGVDAALLTERPALVRQFLGEKTHARANATLPDGVVFHVVHTTGVDHLLVAA